MNIDIKQNSNWNKYIPRQNMLGMKTSSEIPEKACPFSKYFN